MDKEIILASSSPRRKEILEIGKIDFRIIKSNYKEESIEYYDENFLKKNSLYKALDVASNINHEAIIIGADTMVILNSVCLLKPSDSDKAFFMLKKLSGKTHFVATSISLVDAKSKKSLTEVLKTHVTFKNLYDDEIKRYIKDFNPLDKAGSYGIQDFIKKGEKPCNKSFIEKFDGDYYNVMGISLDKVKIMLENFKIR